MTYTAALLALASGKKMNRAGWPLPVSYVQQDGAGVNRIYYPNGGSMGNGRRWTATLADTLATDWQEYV